MESSGEFVAGSPTPASNSEQKLLDIEAKIKNHIKALKTLQNESPSSSRASSITPMDAYYFNERVKTFKITTWFNKPFIVNPLQCSRYGFFNYENDKIECSQCHTKKCLKSS